MSGIMSRQVDGLGQFERATAHLDPPFAVVDLAAFDANATDLVRRATGVPIRVVSKSLRCRHLIERALAQPGYRGVMCYSLAEAIWLHSLGLSDDLLVAYPTADRGALRALAADDAARQHITVTIGSALTWTCPGGRCRAAPSCRSGRGARRCAPRPRRRCSPRRC